MGSRASFFRLDGLRRFLDVARSAREMTSIRDCASSDALILRHDVDLDLTAAVRSAEIERALGITATYCVMTTSALYNAAAPEGRALIRELAATGVDVGLHVWPEAYGRPTTAEHERYAGAEAALIEDITGTPVVSLSIHEPGVYGFYPELGRFRNAYSPAFFSPDRYLSDSRMVLREDPYAFIERTRGRVAQLLLHPAHFTDDGAGYGEIFADLERRHAAAVDRYMSKSSTYREELPAGLLAFFERRSRASS